MLGWRGKGNGNGKGYLRRDLLVLGWEYAMLGQGRSRQVRQAR